LGGFVVAYDLGGNITAQRFGPDGSKLGKPINVHSDGDPYVGDQPVTVYSNALGDFVVAWYEPDSGVFDILAQAFDAGGGKRGGVFSVTGTAEGYVYQPDIALDADGDFVASWYHSSNSVFVQRFSRDGTKLGDKITVNDSLNEYNTFDASVAIDADGDFVVVWATSRPNDNEAGIYAQAFRRDGSRQGDIVRISTAHEFAPRVSMDADGEFTVAWWNYLQVETQSIGIQRFRFDEPPTALNLSNNQIDDQQPVGTEVGVLSTVDGGRPPQAFTYSLVSGTGGDDNALFTLDADGTLRTAAVLDAAVQAVFSIRVQTTDAGGLTLQKQFTISIPSANREPTDITLSNATLAENTAPSAIIGMLTATDPDANNVFTFTLVAGTGADDNALFEIGGNQLRARNGLNFEEQPNRAVRIRVTDQGGKFFEKAFTLTITNVQEAPTNVALSNSTLAENLPANTVVGTFASVDQDVGDTHTYSLVAGAGSTDNAAFTIVGTDLIAMDSFDFEAKSSYSIRVRSTDPAGLFFEKILTITVNNTNESPTDISLSNSTVPENSPSGTVVGNLTTSDPEGGTFAYFLVSGAGSTHNAQFRILGTALQLAAPFSFEANTQFTIRVRTLDSGGLAFDKVLTITAQNVNEAPTNLTISDATVDENQPIGTEVGRFTTTDPDANSSFSYGLYPAPGSTDYTKFQIQGNRLLTREAFNFETKRTYTFRVRSFDNGGLWIEKPFTITVDNVNEAPSQIALSNNKIAERTPAGRTIGNFTGADPDANTTLTWSLVPGALDNAKFRVVGNQLRTSAALDFETDPSHTILVRARDNGGLSLLKAFTIDVTDVSESVLFGMNNVTVAENAAVGTRVATFSIANRYSLVAGVADNAAFKIVGNQLQVAGPINHEAKPLRTLRINVSPRAGVNVPVYFNVAVSNVNETPVIQQANRPASFFNLRRNVPLYAGNLITVSDPDPGAHLGELTATVETSKGTLRVLDRLDVDVVGNDTGRVTITGAQAAINASLAGLVVSPRGAVGDVFVTTKVDDRGNSGPGAPLSTSRTFTIKVTNTLPALPWFANALNYTMSAVVNTLDVSANQGLLRGAVDGDGDVLTVKLVTPPLASAGTLTLRADGSFSFQRLNNFRGTVRFTIRYTDGLADTAVVNVTLFLL
jgi:hypothetical protein